MPTFFSPEHVADFRALLRGAQPGVAEGAVGLRAIDGAIHPANGGFYACRTGEQSIFAATGDLLLTGPTLTNVNDIRVILVD